MDALKIFCGFLITTWLVWTPKILLKLHVDLEKYWTPTISLYLIDPCAKSWTGLSFQVTGLCKNMNATKCCVLNCKNTRPGVILHKFPNPEKELNRYNSWMYAIGGNVYVIDSKSVFKNGRVCHSHFETKYHTAGKRLTNNAVPSLHLSGILHSLPLQDMTNIARQINYTSQTSEQTIPLAPMLMNEPGPSTFVQPAPSTSTGKKGVKKTLIRSFDSDAIMLKHKIKKLQGQKNSVMARLKKALKLSENTAFQKAISKFSTAANIFTMLQFRESGKHKLGCRFTKDEKIMSLALYKQGPRAYRWLRKFFILPSPLTLSRMISRASLHPGINEHLFQQLEKIVKKMKGNEKLCLLLFDEIALTPHFDYNRRTDCVSGFVNNGAEIIEKIADHALVFMVRGVQKNFKQPVSYTFCASTTPAMELASQIKVIIRKVNSIGFKIIATVCDQGVTNVRAVNWLITSTKEKYLREGKSSRNNIFEVDGEEIIPLYDPPHLIKGIRNNLIQKDLKFEVNGQIKMAKWSHIMALYSENPAYKGIRLMPKLTDRHVVPHKIPKMKVKCATQLFSRSVAVNMGYLSSMGILPPECQDTADLLLFFDNLFDSVNGSFYNFTKKRVGKPLLGPVTPNSSHKTVWFESKPVLRSMKFCSGRKSGVVPSIVNWIQTIENMEYIVNVLTKKYNLTSLWMRRFNQDPLENFFGCIRSHGYRNTSPTCVGFEAAYASCLINNFSNTHSPGSNCENDDCTNFKSLKDLFFKETQTSSYIMEIDYEDVNSDNIFVDIEIKWQNPKIKAQLEYVAGYVLRKLKLHKCKNCKNCFWDINKENSTLNYREYNKNKASLTYPSMPLINCFSNIQDVVTGIIKKDCKKRNIRQYIKTIFSVVIDYSFIKCSIHKTEAIKKIEDICVSLFIYNWCKDTNKLLCSSRTDFDRGDRIQELAFNYCKKRFK